jgi:regulatory protein
MEPRPAKPVTARWMMNAAQFYLARHAASEAHLAAVLKRKAQKRAGAPPDEAALAIVAATVEALRQAGLVDDRAFAAARARTLQRKGLSARSARAGLAAKGIDRGLAAETVAEAGFDETRQVVAAARRLRIAAFADATAELTQKDVAKLARRGFALQAIRAGLQAAREEEA